MAHRPTISADTADAAYAETVRDETSAYFHRFADAIPHPLWLLDRDGDVLWLNDRFIDVTGARIGDIVRGEVWRDILFPEDMKRYTAFVREIRRCDATIETTVRMKHVRADDARYRAYALAARPVRGLGPAAYVLVTATERSDMPVATPARDAAPPTRTFSRIDGFAAGAIALVHADNALRVTCEFIAAHAVETIADVCTLDLARADGRIERMAARARNEHAERVRAGRVFLPLEFEHAPHPAARVLATGQGRYVREWTDDEAARVAVNPAHRAYLDGLRIGSAAYVPLAGHQGAFGVLTLFRHAANGYDEHDAAELVDAGRRIGLAMENARRSQRARLIADRFQHAALPKTLPTLPGIAFSAVYRAAKSEAQVGGDWYDAFRLGDGRIVVSIGDVMGTGLDAAVTMGAVRQTIRGATQIHPDPVTVLNAADRTLRTEQPDRIVTAFVGILDPVTLAFTYASAGHPAPFLRADDGEIVELSGQAPPLGLRETGPTTEAARTVTLKPHSLLVLYTDGLTEATRDIGAGERRLREALARPDVREAANPAAAIAHTVSGSVEDDLAILTVRIERVELGVVRARPIVLAPARWSVDPRDREAVRDMRRGLARALRTRVRTEDDIVMTELLLSELLGNVIRHTNDVAEIALDLTMSSPVLHVLDRGPGFSFHPRLPGSVMCESGRGLFIAASLARDVTVAPRPDGGSHARIVLPFELRPAEGAPA